MHPNAIFLRLIIDRKPFISLFLPFPGIDERYTKGIRDGHQKLDNTSVLRPWTKPRVLEILLISAFFASIWASKGKLQRLGHYLRPATKTNKDVRKGLQLERLAKSNSPKRRAVTQARIFHCQFRGCPFQIYFLYSEMDQTQADPLMFEIFEVRDIDRSEISTIERSTT